MEINAYIVNTCKILRLHLWNKKLYDTWNKGKLFEK